MPTYEYQCRSCGESLEVVQSFTDDPLTECPSCQGSLKKVFSPVGIAFKGSGFYKTDSRSGGSSGTGAKDKEKAKEQEKAASTGKDAGDSGSSSTASESGSAKKGSTKKDAKASSGS